MDESEGNVVHSGLVARAKAMILSPKGEWPVVAAETESVQDVFLHYVVPLAAIGPIASFVGGQAFGIGAFGFKYHPSLVSGLTTAVTGYILGLVSIFVISWIANFLAPKFDGRDNFAQAFKLCAYAFTASWVAGVFGLIPSLSVLGLLGLYSLYLFYLGATPMVQVPEDKATGYTAVTVIAAIVVSFIVAAITVPLTASVAGASAVSMASDPEKVEVNLPGYGTLHVEDHGDTKTMEIPGMGKVEMTKDGDVVKINGENFSAEVKDPNADK